MVVGSVRSTLPWTWVIIKYQDQASWVWQSCQTYISWSDKYVKPKLSGPGNQVRSMCPSLVIILDPRCLDLMTNPA